MSSTQIPRILLENEQTGTKAFVRAGLGDWFAAAAHPLSGREDALSLCSPPPGVSSPLLREQALVGLEITRAALGPQSPGIVRVKPLVSVKSAGGGVVGTLLTRLKSEVRGSQYGL